MLPSLTGEHQPESIPRDRPSAVALAGMADCDGQPVLQISGTATGTDRYGQRLFGRPTSALGPDRSWAAIRYRPQRVRDSLARLAPKGRSLRRRRLFQVGELIERYLEEHAAQLAPRSAVDQAVMLRRLVEPHWKNRLVADIDARDVERVLTVIAAGRSRPAKDQPKGKRRKALAPSRPTPIHANRVDEVLRNMFNLSVQWKMRTDNPAASFRRRLEVEPDRFLSTDELARLAETLGSAEDRRGASIIRMCMLTGARLGEVMTARFEHFDLQRGTWIKSAADTKQCRIHGADHPCCR